MGKFLRRVTTLESPCLKRHYATHRASQRITRGLKATATLGWSLRDLCIKVWRPARATSELESPATTRRCT
ncbi:MAG: hypothetical protein ACREH8_01255, partial [Opitutaceae bacterium]